MSYNNGPKMITDGLVLCLDAANIKSYISGSASWLDLSQNNNNVTLVNGPIYSTNNKGAIIFNGTNNYGYGSNNLSIEGPGTLIFTQRYNSISPADNYSTIGICNGSSAGIQIGIQANVASVWKYGGTVLLPYTLPTVGNIQNIAVTFNNSNINIYVNGLLNNSTTSAINQTGFGNLLISTYTKNNPDQQFVNMDIFSVQLYNRILSKTEIMQNYNALNGRFIS